MGRAGRCSAGAEGRFAEVGRAVLLSSASRFYCRWGRGEEGTVVLGVRREALDTGSSLGRGGGLVVGAGAFSVAVESERR